MDGKYEAYPEYRDSGVEWLGAIPVHWRNSSLKYYIQSMVAGGTPESSNPKYWADSGMGIPWVSISDITKGYLISKTNKDVTLLGGNAKSLKILPRGTILYSIFASLGKVAVANVPLTTNQAILGIIPSAALDSKFLQYWLRELESYLSLISSSNTQDNLNAEKVGNLPSVYPPEEEQGKIAAFLDHETAKIDTLIEE
ncbi:restriction endonuclease subunit S [Endozoicomonas sp. SESOKO1]|uniref:restriction endonuclease subunit S n=1 Tax=Endozoicomonas sp. SESOKO1 TaxID=2828742 RepID=UPI00214829E4|nr:restriction endonuclease subunit S [Endozoicomonas sp. SESOKO1]